MKRVEITGWKHGFMPISFIKLLRQSGKRSVSLSEAKDLVDCILVGEAITIDFHAGEEASAFLRQAAELGAITSSPTDVPHELGSVLPDSGPVVVAASCDLIEYLDLDPMSVNEEDIHAQAETWLAWSRLPMSSPERSKLQWVMTLEYDLLESAPEKLWLLILAIHARDQSPRIQEVLSAGPLEDLLGRYGVHFMDGIEEQARKSPSFAKLLGGVWKSTMPDDIWSRVQGVWNRRGWDGIPE